jgi:hypothetical protein
MRKSFAKNKSVLTEDYKYFTTPDVPAKTRNKEVRRAAEQLVPKSSKRS